MGYELATEAGRNSITDLYPIPKSNVKKKYLVKCERKFGNLEAQSSFFAISRSGENKKRITPSLSDYPCIRPDVNLTSLTFMTSSKVTFKRSLSHAKVTRH